jgi:predicted anti-sigma-YlaC factor YlaD
MTGREVCDRMADLLPEFLAGRLSETDDTEVRKHLETCVECRNRANAVSLLQQTPIPQPDPDRWGGFVKGVVDEHDRRHKKERRMMTILTVVAVVVLIAVIAYLVAF